MNIQLLLRVADAISKNEERFDMGRVLHKCGTKGCIAGWVLMLTYGPGGETYWNYTVCDAMKLLGIREYYADKLFYPGSLSNWTAADGVAHIHAFIQKYATAKELEEYHKLQRERIIQVKQLLQSMQSSKPERCIRRQEIGASNLGL